jgi:hypothetical protein
MADIDLIEMKDNNVILKLKLSKDEYGMLEQSTKNLLILPTDKDILDESLTTGKLGNSNRIMLPNKILKKNGITNLLKNAPARVFEISDEKFVFIKLQGSMIGKPLFGVEE